MGREVTCELCGGNFRCNAPQGCWCSGIRLTAGQREMLEKVANDCVCPECLNKAASAKL